MTIEAVAERLSDERLSAYEVQVLLGTSISGCNMSPDATFDLKAAWARLYRMGLIDRADGIACPTDAGMVVIHDILSRRTPASGAGVVKALEWVSSTYSSTWCGARSSIGDYQVDYYEDSDGTGWTAFFGDVVVIGHYATVDEAKAAAQADYEARILSALSSPPPDRDAVLEEAARMADREELTGTPPADFTQREIYITQAAVIATAKSIATAIRALKTKDQP